MIGNRVAEQFVLHGFDIGEGAHFDSRGQGQGRSCCGEAFAHQPDFFATARGGLSQHFGVCIGRCSAQLAHIAENHHLVGCSGLPETGEGGLHRREVGIVGIDDERIVLRFPIFRSIVVRGVVLQGMVDGGQGHFETKSHEHGRQHIIYIVGAHKLRAHLVPCAVGLAPAQRQERRAVHHFALDGVAMSGTAVGERGQTAFGHVGHEKFVIAVDKNEERHSVGFEAGFTGDEGFGDFGVALCKIAVEFGFGFHHTLE